MYIVQCTMYIVHVTCVMYTRLMIRYRTCKQTNSSVSMDICMQLTKYVCVRVTVGVRAFICTHTFAHALKTIFIL